MDRRAILGLLLIVAGIFLLLQNLGLYYLPHYLFSWPMILILIAFFNLLKRNYRGAIIFSIIGVFFLVHRYYDIHMRDWWPLLLIVVGVLFFFRDKKAKLKKSVDGDHFDELALFSGNEKSIVSQQLKKGKITTIFGGSEIDLTESNIDQSAELDMITIFGGSDVTIPAHWKVKVNVISVFGGFNDKRKHVHYEKSPQLTIKGFTLFGGADLKS